MQHEAWHDVSSGSVMPSANRTNVRYCEGNSLPVMQISIRVLLSAGVIIAVSELAKRSSLLGAALASLPLTSLLSVVWFYLGSGDADRVRKLSIDIFCLVIPSLRLFVLLPLLLRTGRGFWTSLLAASAASTIGYGLMGWLLTVYRKPRRRLIRILARRLRSRGSRPAQSAEVVYFQPLILAH